MRRTALAVGTLALAATLALTAEARAQTPVQYGVVAGLTSASMGGDIGDELDGSLMGFVVGASAEVGLGPNFRLRPELTYTRKGAKESVGDDEFRLKMGYVEVPVLAKYAFPVQGSVRPHLLAGPAIAFKTSCTLELEVGGDEESADCEDDGLETKGVDLGVVLGGGVDVGAFSVGVRYNLGLTDVPDIDGVGGKHQVLSVVAGYTFGR